MKSLREIIEDPNVSQSVLTDGLRVLDEEIAKRSGIGGMAIKGAYKVFRLDHYMAYPLASKTL